jgi:hypothetical protein
LLQEEDLLYLWLIQVAKSFVRFELGLYRHSGGSRNPGKIGPRLYSGQSLDPGFRRGDEWQHAITFGKHYNNCYINREEVRKVSGLAVRTRGSLG